MLLCFFLVVATHLVYVIMMLLNVFQKQSPTSELYKQYTPYSVAAPRGGRHWQGGLVVRFMAFLKLDGQIELRVQSHL